MIRRAVQATSLGVACLAVAGLSYAVTYTFVTLVVQGRPPEPISTTVDNVGELLQGEGIELSSGLVVVPPPATELADGMTVVVSPSGTLAALVGTAPPEPVGPHGPGTSDVGVWVVDGASSGPAARIAAVLAEATASATPVGSSPAVTTSVVVVGKVHDVVSNASTVGELLSAMGIDADADDRVQPPPGTPLLDGSLVRFDRVDVMTRQVRRAIAFDREVRWTTDVPIGQTRVLTAGSPGAEAATFRTVWVNGRIESRTLMARDVARAPVDRVVLAGPKSPAGGVLMGDGMRGQATWYETPWGGLTAASPWLPFGTRVTVTDLETGRAVTVIINDRGPFSPGRIIDLSPAAFAVLAPLGHGVLDVRIAF
jgi:resuscitation-promoting factor RpfB